VEHDVERRRFDERIVPAEEARDEDEVGGRRDGQELGESLDEAEDRSVEEALQRDILRGGAMDRPVGAPTGRRVSG